MDTKFRIMAQKPNISEVEWKELVEYLNNDEALALASRIFYFTNQHSTHSFDYFVPDHMEQGKDYPRIAEYLLRAQHLRSLLGNKFACGNMWFLAAHIIVPLNLNDQTYYQSVRNE